MAKSKREVDTGNSFVTTKSMFKALGKSSAILEKQEQKRWAAEKARKAKGGIVSASKSTKKSKHQRKADKHPLAIAFSDNIEDSREHLKNKAKVDIDAAYLGLTQRLAACNLHFNKKEQDTASAKQALTRSLKEQTLQWTTADGKRTGQTTLSHRMKSLQRTVDAEEKNIERYFAEWTKVQHEIEQLACTVLGPDALTLIRSGNFNIETFNSVQQQDVLNEIEAERKKCMEMVEQANQKAMDDMMASEEHFDLQAKKMEDTFMALLRDDEY